MDKLLSIVVPVYRVEQYIRKCLGSLIVSDDLMGLLEVIVVNDGSPDRSADIAKEFVNKYPQTFRVIDKENGNYGSCINRGLKEAKGKYIRICDGDDSYDSEALCKLLKLLELTDADLFLTDYVTVDAQGNVIDRSPIRSVRKRMPVGEVFNFHDYLRETHFEYTPQMHCTTYRTSLLRDMNYHQTEGISYTDLQWATLPITQVKTAFYQPVDVYRYLLGREGQTMDANNQIKNVRNLYQMLLDMAEFYQKGDYDTFYKPFIKLVFERNMYSFYPDVILFCHGDAKALSDFDERLKKYPDLYRLFASHTHLHGLINYVELWRRRGYKKLPWLYRKIGGWLEMNGRKSWR